MAAEKGVEPVFLLRRSLPGWRPFGQDNATPTDRYDSLEICLAAEKTSGVETILGAQDIRGLWRIYPLTRHARNSLLINGITIRGVSLQVHDKNPFVLKPDSNETPATKVWISDIPISCASEDIENALGRVGCSLRSSILLEKSRNADGKLTRFLTGRRFVFIAVPTHPLEKSLQIGGFTARIYHKEQPKSFGSVTCTKCLEVGHKAGACVNPIKCKACKQSGHKQGDPLCTMPQASVWSLRRDFDQPPHGNDKQSAAANDDSDPSSIDDDASDTNSVDLDGTLRESQAEETEGNEDNGLHAGAAIQVKKRVLVKKGRKGEAGRRGRPHNRHAGARQTQLQFEARPRSLTPKRQREGGDSPDSAGQEKQVRLDTNT